MTGWYLMPHNYHLVLHFWCTSSSQASKWVNLILDDDNASHSSLPRHSFSPSVSPGHSPGPESIDRWDIPSPHVRRLGVEPRSYRQQSFTSCQASWCWTTILQTMKIKWNRNRFSIHWVSPVWTSLLLFTLTKNLLFLVPSFSQPSVLT